MIRAAILGSTGYTALELIKILLVHPQVEVTVLTTRQDGAPHVSEVHPSLHGRLDVRCQSLGVAEISERADVVFGCLPHGASMATIPELLGAGLRVIDLSADYRLDDAETYQQWYGLEHTDSQRLAETPYGLPELPGHRVDETAALVANPGCYTSTSILGLAPLLGNGLIEPTGIIIDAKSGVSGAGRSPKLGTLYPECNESLSAYGVGNHRHTPEIAGVLSRSSGQDVQVVFTPHLVPMDRGILCTIYCRPIAECSSDAVLQAMRSFYDGCPFVRIVDHLPRTRDVAGTNYCDITVRESGGHLLVFSALDNLIKGAAGVAVQNFNLMYGLAETTGLLPAAE
ncbi:MAG: N-acetyl-gamma-glutamyl-phosphate reductase [Planctomycetota bacterium]|nr:N-acetyl-gamma-glutamyl-phosphate reductase [Planctomycetota bacterium]